MSIHRDDVVKAAQLARIALRDDEIARIAGDLEKIVGYVEQLQQVDVEGVEPMVQPFDLEPVVRSDEAQPVLGRRALEGSQGYDDGLVRVPRVVE